MTARRAAIGIVLLTVLAYLPSVARNNFVTLDDTLLITRNAAVHGFSAENLRTIFTTYDPELYVPLTLLTYQMEYVIAELHPILYHTTNLALHALSIFLLFYAMLLLLRLSKNTEEPEPGDVWMAAVVAALFALHPMQTEAVAWAAARKDVLSGLMAIASLHLYLRWIEHGAQGMPIGSAIAFGAGLFAKVSILPLTLLFFVIDWALGRPMNLARVREKTPHLLLALTLGIVALFGKTSQLEALTFFERTILSVKAFGLTLLHLLIPLRLRVFYPQTQTIALGDPAVIGSLAAVLALAFLFFLALRRGARLQVLGLVWFVLFLAPSLVTFYKNGMLFITSDRYAYIAMIGLALSAASVLVPLLLRHARFAGAITVLILASCITGTFVQAGTWRDSVSLYTHALRFDPAFPMALGNLGSALMEEGRDDEALPYLEQAIAADPTTVAAHLNIGLMRRESGDIEGALAAYEQAVAAVPEGTVLEQHAAAFFFLGELLEQMGRTEDALATFREATVRAPELADTHLNLGIMLQKYGRRTEARTALAAALELRPRELDARYRLASIEAELGNIEAAIEHLEIIVARDPDYEDAARHLNAMRALRPQP